MSVNLATRTRNASGNAIVDLIDDGTVRTSGYIEIRDGDRPANPQTAPTDVLLSRLLFSDPAFGNFVNGRAQANPITQESTILENGIAKWFRVYNRDNNAILDGLITTVGEDGDIEFENVNFIKGGTVIMDGLEAIMPQ